MVSGGTRLRCPGELETPPAIGSGNTKLKQPSTLPVMSTSYSTLCIVHLQNACWGVSDHLLLGLNLTFQPPFVNDPYLSSGNRERLLALCAILDTFIVCPNSSLSLLNSLAHSFQAKHFAGRWKTSKHSLVPYYINSTSTSLASWEVHVVGLFNWRINKVKRVYFINIFELLTESQSWFT